MLIEKVNLCLNTWIFQTEMGWRETPSSWRRCVALWGWAILQQLKQLSEQGNDQCLRDKLGAGLGAQTVASEALWEESLWILKELQFALLQSFVCK